MTGSDRTSSPVPTIDPVNASMAQGTNCAGTLLSLARLPADEQDKDGGDAGRPSCLRPACDHKEWAEQDTSTDTRKS